MPTDRSSLCASLLVASVVAVVAGGACSNAPLPGGSVDLAGASTTGDGGVTVDAAMVGVTDLAVTTVTDLAGPSVPCGDAACLIESGNACCVSPTIVETCASACGTMDYTYLCDGPEDCSGGLVCCFDLDHRGTYCAMRCDMTSYHLCHGRAECPFSRDCVQLEWGPPPLFACF